MLRIDRHITIAFATALASTLLLIAILFVVLDAFPNLDNYALIIKRDGFLVGIAVIARYYVMHFLTQLSGFGEIIAATSAIVVVAGMARSNEFVAMLAGGMSLRRVALPVFVCCGLVGVGIFALRNGAGPDLARGARDDWRIIKGRGAALGRSLSVQGRSGEEGESAVALSVEEYDPSTSTGTGFAVAVIAPGKPFVDIRADVAVWDGDAHAWRFPHGAHRWSYGSNERTEALTTIRAFETGLGPDLLEAEDLGASVVGLGGLLRQRSRPEFAAELHERLAQILAPLALALIALPFVLTTDRTRVFQGTMLAAITVIGYEMVAHICGSASATGYIPAIVGGWLAPVAFGGLGAWRLCVIDT